MRQFAQASVTKNSGGLTAVQPFMPLAVLLNLGCAKTRHTVAFDSAPPGDKLFERKLVTRTGFRHAQQATFNGSDHFGLAPCDPAGRTRVGQLVQRQLLAKRTNNFADDLIVNVQHIPSPKERRLHGS
jgi:hypothetical protein